MAALFTLRMRLPPGVDASAALGGLALDDDASASGHAPRGDGEEASSTSSAPGRVLAFSAGNPRADVISGRIHLYRDAAADAPGGAGASSPAPSRRGDALPAGRQPLVCVLAVPSSLSISDFCQFAAALLPKVVEMRVVRSEGEGEGEGAGAGAGEGNDGSAAGSGSGSGAGNDGSAAGSGSGSGARDAPRALAPSAWYSVLMRFEDQDAADAFALNYHNRRFNSFVEGTCTALFVRRVEMDPRPPSSSPSSSSSSAPPPPPAGAVELPSCPVCLDRLDQDVSGVVTTVCAHSFHHACLSKWGDSSCPVCRYTQRPEDAARCHECGSTEELWACLVCGVVGCGRYAGGCAVAHWKQTDHCYSLELATQRVWDYVRDGFVHRLIQSKTGLVELAPGRRRRGGARRARASGAAGTSTAATGEEAGARRGRGARGSGVGLGGELGGELAGASRGARSDARSDGVGDDDDSGLDSGLDSEDFYRRPGKRSEGGPGGGSPLDHGLGEYDADYPLDPGLEEALVSSKLDAIHSEYNQLLTSQLDSQRRYFERLMAAAEAEREGAATAAAAAKERAAAVASAVDDARDARRSLKEAHEKLDAEMGRRAKVEEERDFLRSLNDTLLANQRAFEEKTRALERDAEASAREKDARIRDLEEQVRDLMVFLDAQSKVQESVGGDGGTIEGGSVVGVGEGDEGPSRDAAHARLQKKLAGRRREKHAETRG